MNCPLSTSQLAEISASSVEHNHFIVAPVKETAGKETAAVKMSSSPSSVDIESAIGNPTPSAPNPSFWSRVTKAVNVAEEHIANFFGLNESKYQWALDEYTKQRLSGDATIRPTSPRTSEDQPGMQPTGLQIMDRNINHITGR